MAKRNSVQMTAMTTERHNLTKIILTAEVSGNMLDLNAELRDFDGGRWVDLDSLIEEVHRELDTFADLKAVLEDRGKVVILKDWEIGRVYAVPEIRMGMSDDGLIAWAKLMRYHHYRIAAMFKEGA